MTIENNPEFLTTATKMCDLKNGHEFGFDLLYVGPYDLAQSIMLILRCQLSLRPSVQPIIYSSIDW